MGGRREEGSGWGTHVYLWRIHFDTWQNEYNIVKFKNKIQLKKKHSTIKKTTQFKNGLKTLTDLSPQKIHNGKYAYEKTLYSTCHQRSANKSNNEISQHTDQNGQNLEYFQHQMLMRIQSNRSSYSLLVAMQSGAATFKDSLAVSYKTRCTLTIRSSSHTPWCLPKGAENLSPQKKYTHRCLWKLYSQLPELGSNQDVLQQVNG